MSTFKIFISIFLSLVTFSMLCIQFIIYFQEPQHRPPVKPEVRKFTGFLVNTPLCKIPDIDPFGPSVPERVKQKRHNIHCAGKPLTYKDGTMLRINRTIVMIDREIKDQFNICGYRAVTRRHGNDFSFVYSLEKMFDSDIEIRDEEFIGVRCYDHSGRVFSAMFYAFVFPKKEVEARCHHRLKRHMETVRPKEILNVEMIGVDSVSRLNMMRQMPRTRQFLLGELGAVEMVGYNKVGDNTLPNILAMLSGKLLAELHHDLNGTLDKHSFVWKNFSAAGYRTLYAEDAPSINAFSINNLKGFENPPADYYLRPLSLAMEKYEDIWSQGHNCLANILEMEMPLMYHTDFSRLFRNRPHFAFTFISRLTHDQIDLAGASDDIYYRFLEKLKTEGRLENTVLIYFSDHGIRTGRFRNTDMGKLEVRLPLMFVVLPSWFKSRYSKLYYNLQVNSNRLTSPFDVYETLKDILFFDGEDRGASLEERGISFFREIPKGRGCAHAGIQPQWCTCNQKHNVSTSITHVRMAALEVVRSINSVLAAGLHRCAHLSLKKIHSAQQMTTSNHGLDDKVLPSLEDDLLFQLTVETEPGNGKFEATVRFDRHAVAYKLTGEITRINRYGTQSKCVNDFKLKQFCFCVYY